MQDISIIGGGAQSDVWCQIFADVLNRNIKKVAQPIDANARGAAFIAFCGLGHISFDDIPNLIKYDRVFQPDPANRVIYAELMGEFLNIYKNNRKMYDRLNRDI
jgi:xylulokinase